MGVANLHNLSGEASITADHLNPKGDSKSLEIQSWYQHPAPKAVACKVTMRQQK